MNTLFAKLLVIIYTAGAIGVTLLVLRQQRIDTIHKIAEVHQQLIEHEKQVWSMRREVAEYCRPAHVREMMQQLNTRWTPIPSTPGIVPPPPNSTGPDDPRIIAQWGPWQDDEQFGG